ncbi:zinc finger protein 300-like [Brachionichthys hirsutus]|uniref:zinc finger protein 300-like n=1 Tax=Brachionichthys hirsutus TaxID=412623 RepID=UPI00360440EB
MVTQMAEARPLKALVQQRLAAAAEDIFELFERTIAEYEQQLGRQRKRLDKQQVRSHRAGIKLLLVNNEEDRERSASPAQEDSQELPRIKEEHGELWTSREEHATHGPDEAGVTEFTFHSVLVKSEGDDEEEAQSSQVYQTEEVKTEADWVGPDPDRKIDPGSHLQSETEREPQSGLPRLRNDSVAECLTGKAPDASSERSTSYPQEQSAVQAEADAFSCSVCGKKYNWKKSLNAHMRLHSEGKGFSCPFCRKTFPFKGHVVTHMRVHTGEKPFSCSLCGRRFTQKGSLRGHMRIHTGEKPSGCSVCGKKFGKRGNLREHMKIHTREKAFSCSVCGKNFGVSSNLRQHTRTHSGEKPFGCSVCEKSFTRLAHMKKHKCVGESSGS